MCQRSLYGQLEERIFDSFAKQVDFERPELCAQTRPLSCTIGEDSIALEKRSWASLFRAVTEWFIATDNPKLDSLQSSPLYGRSNFFLPQEGESVRTVQLSNGKCLSLNYGPKTIVKIIKKLCRFCGVPLEEVVITYAPKEEVSFSPASTESYSQTEAQTLLPKLSLDPALIEELFPVLAARFNNGFRIDDLIALRNFRRFAEEHLQTKLTLTDEELKAYIRACGIFCNNRIYPVSKEAKEYIKKFVEEYFKEEVRTIFYEKLYAEHKDCLDTKGVAGKDVLKNTLQNLFPKLSFKRHYFGKTNATMPYVVRDEILRVWGDSLMLSYDQIAKRLPLVPLKRIQSALSQNADFLWNSQKTYALVRFLQITEEECKEIRAVAEQECKANEYIPIVQLPIDSISARHHELSLSAIREAAYHICLSEKFDKRDYLIVSKDVKISALGLMKEYCRSVERCTLKDLMARARELAGESYRKTSLEAGYAILVRIDRQTFVAESQVHFQRDEIDRYLDMLIRGDYFPLKHFRAFSLFPDCGQTWNHFLLESYCRRFSDRFRFDVPYANSRNAGVIIRKSCRMDYEAIMIDVVLKAEIPLTGENVNNFLYEQGYIGKKMRANSVREFCVRVRGMR